MKTFEYSDKMMTGRRHPHLVLVRDNESRLFTGSTIPGWCVVLSEIYERAGIWSGTNYVLGIPENIQALHLFHPLHGKWGQELHNWAEAETKLGTDRAVTQKIVRMLFPDTAQRFDYVDEAIETLAGI